MMKAKRGALLLTREIDHPLETLQKQLIGNKTGYVRRHLVICFAAVLSANPVANSRG